jgi:hypothetical protein
MAQDYPPNGPDIPVITVNEDSSGAYDQDLKQEPAPNPPDQQSIWNMKVVGFNDNQARPVYQPLIVDEDGRYIAYMGNLAGVILNPLTGAMESNGTSLIDVTNPKKPVFVYHIPGPAITSPVGVGTAGPARSSSAAGAQMVRVCSGSVLPHGTPGKWYMLRAFGNSASTDTESHELWDVTNPSAPVPLALSGAYTAPVPAGVTSYPLTAGEGYASNTVLGGLSNTHKSWWECDTGIAYLVAGAHADNWQQSGSAQHLYIFDLSNPSQPKYIRQFGLVGQQPGSSNPGPCATDPTVDCYEGTTNPPSGIHGPISMGTTVNRIYMPYGVGSDGVIQIDDRSRVVNGCNTTGLGGNPDASANCANKPTQADLLWPQVSWVTMNPENGGHSSMPILDVPIPEEQTNYLDGTPQSKSVLFVASEGTANNCLGQAPHDAWILDIGNVSAANPWGADSTPWGMGTMSVPQDPGDFCAKGARFGAHAVTEFIYPPYYGKIIGVSWFNAGVRIWDMRDPKNVKPIAYYIQAPSANTECTSSTIDGVTNCYTATMNDYVEYDDRGYIYGADRAGTGLTILQLSGAALDTLLPLAEQ